MSILCVKVVELSKLKAIRTNQMYHVFYTVKNNEANGENADQNFTAPSNPLLHRYSFWNINNRRLLKTLWEKEKLLVTSYFSFSHNVFYPIRISICTYFSHHIFIFAAESEEPKIRISGKGLKNMQITGIRCKFITQQKSRLVNKLDLVQRARKHTEKKRKMPVTYIFHINKMF